MCKMKEMVFARAALLAGEMEEKQEELLRLLCEVSVSALAGRLRDGVSVESCREEFLAAAALEALAALKRVEDTERVQEFKAGDLTVKQGGGTEREGAAECLQKQAQALMAPYVQDCFAFVGV